MTASETEILELLTEGLSKKEIAPGLFVIIIIWQTPSKSFAFAAEPGPPPKYNNLFRVKIGVAIVRRRPAARPSAGVSSTMTYVIFTEVCAFVSNRVSKNPILSDACMAYGVICATK